MLQDIVVCTIISILVWGLWGGLELLFYGEIQYRKVDDIIGFILVYSLFQNYKERKDNDNG